MGTKHGTHRDMTVEEHLETSEETCTAQKLLESAFFRCQKFYGWSHRNTQKLHRVNKIIRQLHLDLDTDYHRVINDETFYKYGHIYYEKRRDKK